VDRIRFHDECTLKALNCNGLSLAGFGPPPDYDLVTRSRYPRFNAHQRPIPHRMHICIDQSLAGVVVPVGTLITERPPDGSVRARLRIRLL
jgi:hypothetical protein